MLHLALLFATTVVDAQAPPPGGQAFPVRWEAKVAPPGRAGLDAQMKQRPRGMEPDDALDNVDDKGENHPIRTCDDYEKAKKEGWAPANNAQGATESWFIGTCDVVKLLLKAKPSRVSYVGDLKMDRTALDLLPPSIADMPDDDARLERAAKAGLSLRQYLPKLKILAGDPGHLRISEVESMYDIEIVGYGDFNGDGFEDVLLSRGSYATHGSMHVYDTVILTRTKPTGLLSIIAAK
jgi:hypothetical protein